VEQTPAEREQDADERDRVADERDRVADERDREADQRERAADERDRRTGTAAEDRGRPVPAEDADDHFGINLGPSAERPEVPESEEPPTPEPSPRTLSERLAAAAVDRDESDTPDEGTDGTDRSPDD